MVAADGDHTALANGPVFINNVVGYPAADINNNNAGCFFLVIQDGVSGRHGVDHYVFHVDSNFADAADGALDPVYDAVNDVIIGFQFRATDPDRVDHALATIDIVLLQDGVKDVVVLRQTDFLVFRGDIFDFLLRDFAPAFDSDGASMV